MTPAGADRPNVVLIITDDQGFGDLGAKGNPLIRTPNLDAMASRSAEMTRYYVSPVCAPTRACLMTGRYNYRTRCIDTYVGRAMMEPDEVTIAERLRDGGYATGIFGKWHLGDCYPMRPMDQGFEESLVHRGGGIGQPSDPTGGEGKYTDPVLFHNGSRVTPKGYCTDIYFDHGMKWMTRCREAGRPFFCYLPTNAPHGPFHDVPEDELARYREMDLSNKRFPQEEGAPLPEKANLDIRARIYAMISNIDENVGRLFEHLKSLGVLENTLVLFMVDNGPNRRRYVAGFRGQKSFVHEGGIRSPLYLHWPARLEAGRRSDEPVAHIDIHPTLLEACGIAAPGTPRPDGRSFLSLLTGRCAEWRDRPIVIQTHRGDVPVKYHHFALITREWKLVHPSGFGRERFEGPPAFELYNLIRDPFELRNEAAARPEIVARLKAAYDAWWEDVGSTRPDNYAPPRIVVGSSHENPVVLTRQDWRHDKGRPWGGGSNGYWLLRADRDGPYEVILKFHKPAVEAGEALLTGGADPVRKAFAKGDVRLVFEEVDLRKGPLKLQATLFAGSKDQECGPLMVVVKTVTGAIFHPEK